MVESAALQLLPAGGVEKPLRLPPIPWRDPHSVEPGELKSFIAMLEQKCIELPASADVRTCLGMAHAMNFDVYKSMDALEEARRLEPENFFAQMKYSELYYRLRALDKAEVETKLAIELAGNGWELSLARKQIAEIRRMKREGTQKPAWTKSLVAPVAVMGLMLTAVCGLMIFLR